MGSFVHPNLLGGTRTGAGWTRNGVSGGNGFSIGTGLELCNSKSTEGYLWSPPVQLRHGTAYSLSFYCANTANMPSSDIHVLYADSTVPGWIAKEFANVGRGPGGGGSMGHLPFRRHLPKGHTAYASTTTEPRQAARLSYGSATLCSANRKSPAHGLLHRKMGGHDGIR